MIFQNSPNILVNFEILLAVFIPNTPRKRAISYTNRKVFPKSETNDSNNIVPSHSHGVRDVLLVEKLNFLKKLIIIINDDVYIGTGSTDH